MVIPQSLPPGEEGCGGVEGLPPGEAGSGEDDEEDGVQTHVLLVSEELGGQRVDAALAKLLPPLSRPTAGSRVTVYDWWNKELGQRTCSRPVLDMSTTLPCHVP